MATMKAVLLPEFGGADKLQVTATDRPEPGPGELLVRLAATSVNPVDYKTREGKFPAVGADKLPVVLGRDVSGSIAAVGDGAEAEAGENVFGMPGFDRGSYAEYAILKPGEFARVPEGQDPEAFGAIPLAALTAWQGLFRHGGLEKGQRVLIHGGAGGVGHLAVQFARVAGAEVFATAGGDDLQFVSAIGAVRAIDYKTERFEEVARDMDLVYDLIGGDTQARSFGVLKPGGALISTVEEPDADKAKAAGLRVAKRYMAEPSGEELATVAKLIVDGEVEVAITERFPLDQAAAAQDRAENGHVRGKILLTVD